MEKTLIILKPDTVKRGLVGEILQRFERAGLKIVAMKMDEPSEEHYYKHYEEIGKMISRRGQKAFDVTLALMQDGPVIAVVLEGANVVKQVRKMVGTTAPEEAQPGTIRGDYAHMGFAHADEYEMGIPNIIHASGDPEEAAQEIAHWFSGSEIFDNYQTVHEVFTTGNKPKSKKK
jgi:nucleoside-diphosphate kinase